MGIKDISMVINGVKISMESATNAQLTSVISALNNSSDSDLTSRFRSESIQKKPVFKSRDKIQKSRKRPFINNTQIEDKPTKIKGSLDVDLALNSKMLSRSFDSGKSLPSDSEQLKARQLVVWVFLMNDNQSLPYSKMLEALNKEYKGSLQALKTYISQCARLGVLAKNTETGGYHLSNIFISRNQIKDVD